MIKRIILLIETPFETKVYKLNDIEFLQKSGFKVEVWNLMHIFHSEFTQEYTSPHLCQFDGLKIFKEEKEAYNQLENLSNSDFVMNRLGYYDWTLKAYRALSKSQAKYAVFFYNAVPIALVGRRSSMLKKAFLNFIYFKREKSKFFVLWKKIFRRIPFSWLGIRPASLIVAGGENCFIYRAPTNKSTEILKVHAWDYDFYLKERNNSCKPKPIAVFIDEFLPFHPDAIFEGRKRCMTAEQYYPLINRFFEHIEKEANLEVVIAACPKSQHENYAEYFNGRTCVRGKTGTLIRECQVVLAHRSTAVNFANLWNKPVIFMTSLEIEKTLDGKQIKEMAKWFGKNPIAMENPEKINFGKEFTIDTKQYHKFKRAYIKMEGSEDKFFWQIVVNRLKKGF